MSPATMDVQKMPAPNNSPTIISDLSPDAAAIEANISGQPFPKASSVTP